MTDETTDQSLSCILMEPEASTTPTRHALKRLQNKKLGKAARNPYPLRSSLGSSTVESLLRRSGRRVVSTGSTTFEGRQNLNHESENELSITDGKDWFALNSTVADIDQTSASGLLTQCDRPKPTPHPPTTPNSAPSVLQTKRTEESGDSNTDSHKRTRRSPTTTPKSRRGRATTLKPSQVDEEIIRVLGMPVDTKRLPEGEIGYNYLLEVITAQGDGKKILKIGVTKDPGERRSRDIINVCKHLHVEQQDDPERLPIRLYQKAEKLMHAELKNFLYSFHCLCGTEHREYFDVNTEVARDVVRRWRAFCRREPYDSDGNLRPFWQQRLVARKLCDESETTSDHEARRRRWQEFMCPSEFEILLFDMKLLFVKSWSWRWQIVSFVQSFSIALITFPSFSTFIMFAMLCAWIIAEMGKAKLSFSVFLLKQSLYGLHKRSLSRVSTSTLEETVGKIRAMPAENDTVLQNREAENSLDTDETGLD